ncbi:MAG: hypothetical protein ACOX81_02420 [Candidatus Heteroscillospira sp.]|jgi:hypothetical protein
MDITQEVLDRALIFLGGTVSDKGRERLTLLCRLAVDELESRLRRGEDIIALGERFTGAAGVLALSMYAALGDEDFSSVKIGSITVKRRDGNFTDNLRSLAEELLAGCLYERGFDFRGVMG